MKWSDYPKWMPVRRTPYSTERCDMWVGWCACGAVHEKGDHLKALREDIARGRYAASGLSDEARCALAALPPEGGG